MLRLLRLVLSAPSSVAPVVLVRVSVGRETSTPLRPWVPGTSTVVAVPVLVPVIRSRRVPTVRRVDVVVGILVGIVVDVVVVDRGRWRGGEAVVLLRRGSGSLGWRGLRGLGLLGRLGVVLGRVVLRRVVLGRVVVLGGRAVVLWRRVVVLRRWVVVLGRRLLWRGGRSLRCRSLRCRLGTIG